MIIEEYEKIEEIEEIEGESALLYTPFEIEVRKEPVIEFLHPVFRSKKGRSICAV